ncbi:MAG: AraC family transcriptional regulator [Clostridia bacterium]|nr:AraC family transcriptional regulator [Clostridia bacterium]
MPTFYENRTNRPLLVKKGSGLISTPHLHNHLELIYLQDGATETVCDNQREVLSPGDIFLSFPNQIHFYPKIGNGRAIHSILIFDPNFCREFKELFHRMTPTSAVVRKENLNPDIPLLIEKLLLESKNDTPYRDAVLRGLLIALLGKLFPSMEFREERKSDGTILKNILNYCNKHYTEPLSLEVLAKEFGVGKYHISHIFGEKLKISFPDYVNGLRINDAIKKLAENPDQSVTQIAYDCGFNSTRTFNRAFVKFTETTPREYREKHLHKKVTPINFYILE